MTQKCLERDGSWIYVDVYGEPDGSAVVMIPGVMADSAVWGRVARRITGWPTVAVVNRRGRHPSGPLTSAYSLAAEVQDARAVMGEFTDVRSVFGWSYGGLIALSLANTTALPHVMAYEPITAPFGAAALRSLQAAHEGGDWDRSLEVVFGDIAGMPGTAIDALRADPAQWEWMRKLSRPVYHETRAIQDAPAAREFAAEAARIDLIIGERNQGRPPYGTTFDDVVRRTPRGAVHSLAGQGHVAHLEAPGELAAFVDRLRVPPA